MSDTEANGRWRFQPQIALTIAGIILAFGVAYGTLLTNQVRAADRTAQIADDLAEIKAMLRENYFTRAEIERMQIEIDARLDALEKRR